MTATQFDFNEPIPDLHIHKSRSWEPAARHYQDLTAEEKVEEAKP